MSNFEIKRAKPCYEIAQSISKWIPCIYLPKSRTLKMKKPVLFNRFQLQPKGTQHSSGGQQKVTQSLKSQLDPNLHTPELNFGPHWRMLSVLTVMSTLLLVVSLLLRFNKYNFCQLPVIFCNCLLPILSDIILPISPSGSGDGTCHIWRAIVSSPEQVRRFLLLLLCSIN